MRKGLIFNKLVFTTLTFVVLGMILISCADAGMYETLQRDGKLRVIVKFKQFVADSISYKLGEDGEAYGDLNEYVLRKIDTKYNLKKLEKLYKDRDNSDNPNSYSRQLDDYFVIEVDKDEDDAELVCRGLESLFEVDAVEQDIKVNISVEPLPDVDYIPNDYYVSFDGLNWSSYMWGLQKVQVFEAWDLFSDAQTEPGRDIVVAVIDTGVNFSHPDISANKWINTSEIPGNGVDDDGNGYIDDINGWDFVSNDNNPSDVHGHGTHCSGTIAGVTNNTIGVAGISPNTRIMAVKGLNDYGSGYISWLSNCIIYAADNGADVLSNSWGGGGSSSTLTTAVNYAHAKGCLVVAAAGNSNTNVSGFMPANIPNAIAVAATDRNDVKAYFSNYGPGIDISAPGVAILSTVGAGYSSWSGTSMACPHVSGIAALMFSIDPNLTNTEIREKLKSTADNIDAENPSWQGQLGTGRVNAYKAILSCDSGRHSPILEPIGNKTIEEGSALSFVVNASDEDGDALIYSVAGLPGGLVSSGDARFYLQSETAYEGTRALQSGSITENEISIVTKELDMSSDGEVSFYWKVSSLQDDGKLGFYVDGIKRSEISGMTEWQEFSLTLNKGSYLLSWKYTKETDATAGQDAGWIDFIKVTMGEDLTYDFEDGHMPDEFTTGGDGTFHVQSPYAHTGYYSIMGEQITDNQSQYLETTIETGADSEISFWCQVASEYYYDYFKFYIDGVLKVQISGIVSWHRQSFSLGPGTHTLKWEYVKDYSVRAGMDTAWIDDIVIKNANQETINFEQVQGEPNPLPNGASLTQIQGRLHGHRHMIKQAPIQR